MQPTDLYNALRRLYPPGGLLMPWTRPHRWISFLLLVSVLSLGMAFGILLARGGMGAQLTPTEERFVVTCIILAGGGGAFARMEYVARKNKHDARNDLNRIGLQATTAANEATAAREQAEIAVKELPARVVQEMNGGLKKAAQQALDDSPFPTTHEQLAEFVRTVRNEECEQILERAYPKMLQAAREAGWQPPQQA